MDVDETKNETHFIKNILYICIIANKLSTKSFS